MMRITTGLLAMAAGAFVLLFCAVAMNMQPLADFLGKAVAALVVLAFPVAMLEALGLFKRIALWLNGR